MSTGNSQNGDVSTPASSPFLVVFVADCRCRRCGEHRILPNYSFMAAPNLKVVVYVHRFAVAPALTHWGRVTHICVSKLTTIGSDNGLSPSRLQAIIWTNAGILLIRPLGTNVSEISIKIHNFSFKKINLKMSYGKWRPFCLGLNVLSTPCTTSHGSWIFMQWLALMYTFTNHNNEQRANGRLAIRSSEFQ